MGDSSSRTKPDGKLILLLDFDGCIHSYQSGWQGATIIPDPPVKGVFEWLEATLIYFDIYVMSARSSLPGGKEAMYEYVKKYAGPHSTIATRLRFVSEKPSCFITIDDRCIRFDGNWSDGRFDPKEILKFVPWYQQARYRSVGIDMNNPNPDGSDYRIMNEMDREES
jgi:hypothetical protein